MLRTIAVEHVDSLAMGASLLGAGGGGDVTLGAQLLRHALRDHPVTVTPACDLHPEALVVHVGVVGAPDVLAERLIDPHDLAVAANAVVEHVRGELGAIGVIEIGGLNALTAVLAAASLGLPVIDGDLMGRAFPRISQTTLAVGGHPAAPIALVGPAGDIVVVPTSSARTSETLVAACANAMGGAAALALYPATAGLLDVLGVHGSLTSCWKLGGGYLAGADLSPSDHVTRLNGRIAFAGRVDEIRPRQDRAPGSVTLSNQVQGSTARVDLIEEFLAVTVDGITIACTPDLIVAVDPINRQPLRTDQIRLGQSLVVFTLPTLHTWPAEAESVVGPAAFGLDLSAVSR